MTSTLEKLLYRFYCAPAEACMRSGEDDYAKNADDSILQFCEREALILQAHCVFFPPCADKARGQTSSAMPGPAGACMVAVRERKRASKTAKRGGASRASAALGRSARQPFTAEAHAQLRDAIIAVQTDWSDAHGRVSKAALCEADEDAVEDAQKACQTLREEGGMGWMARVRVVKRGNRHWEEDSAVLHHQLVGMVCDGRTAGAGGMQLVNPAPRHNAHCRSTTQERLLHT